MKRASRTLVVSLLFLALASVVAAGPGWAQGKTDLTVALSSFSTEVLDPVLGGHIVKYYLSMMFDYLVGTTLDGQPSKDGGIATRWENSPDYKRTWFDREGPDAGQAAVRRGGGGAAAIATPLNVDPGV